MSVSDRRARFRALHQAEQLFVMPNPWDIGSARLLASSGFQALATTFRPRSTRISLSARPPTDPRGFPSAPAGGYWAGRPVSAWRAAMAAAALARIA